MVKKVFLALAATIFLAGLALTATPSESVAARSHCFKAAKAKAGDAKWKDRRAARKACKKAWKAAHGGKRRKG
jgi:hypothetical protein